MPGPKKRDEPPRRTLTVRLPVPVIERLRKVARDAAGMPVFASMAGIVEAGVTSECDRIEKVLRAAYSGGTEPPATRRTLAGSRRLGPINNRCVDIP